LGGDDTFRFLDALVDFELKGVFLFFAGSTLDVLQLLMLARGSERRKSGRAQTRCSLFCCLKFLTLARGSDMLEKHYLVWVVRSGIRAGEQEFMILPVGATSFTEAMQQASEVYHHLKGIIKKKYGQDACNVGDEGGFAPNISSNEEGLNLVNQAIAVRPPACLPASTNTTPSNSLSTSLASPSNSFSFRSL
jgi:Enolase, C-terminal TIM barrel domain